MFQTLILKSDNIIYIHMKQKIRGFTLIELLIVIAIIGILTGIVLANINPQGKLAEARDSSRKEAVSQLANAISSYSITSTDKFPIVTPTANNWIQTLIDKKEIKSIPSKIPTNDDFYCQQTTTDTQGNIITWSIQNGYCYARSNDGSQAIISTPLESPSEIAKCPSGTKYAYFVWSSSTGTSKICCNQAGS